MKFIELVFTTEPCTCNVKTPSMVSSLLEELNCLKSEKVEHMTVINWIRVQSLKHHSADSIICFTKKYIREFRFLLCYLTVQKEEFRKLIISTRAATFWKEYAKQQCIPVGCVPSAALAVSGSGWGVCLGMCVHPPVNRITDGVKTLPFHNFVCGR